MKSGNLGGNNVMIGNTLDATSSDDIIVTNNYIASSTQIGVFLAKSQFAKVHNNIILNNTNAGIEP
jgi:hypothetical protein